MKCKTYPMTPDGFQKALWDIETRKYKKAVVKGIIRLGVYGLLYIGTTVITGNLSTIAFTQVADASIKAFKIIMRGV